MSGLSPTLGSLAKRSCTGQMSPQNISFEGLGVFIWENERAVGNRLLNAAHKISHALRPSIEAVV